jgi:hypothetical protein
VQFVHLQRAMKHRSTWMRTAALLGLTVAAIVAKMAAPDVRRYVRIKTM